MTMTITFFRSGTGRIRCLSSIQLQTISTAQSGCRSTFKEKDWTATRRSLERHLERNHDLRISPTAVRRARQTATIFAYACTQCDQKFLTTGGLRNRLQWHHDQLVRDQNAAILPTPATWKSQRTRGVIQATADRAEVLAVPTPEWVDHRAVPGTEQAVVGVVPATKRADDRAVPAPIPSHPYFWISGRRHACGTSSKDGLRHSIYGQPPGANVWTGHGSLRCR